MSDAEVMEAWIDSYSAWATALTEDEVARAHIRFSRLSLELGRRGVHPGGAPCATAAEHHRGADF